MAKRRGQRSAKRRVARKLGRRQFKYHKGSADSDMGAAMSRELLDRFRPGEGFAPSPGLPVNRELTPTENLQNATDQLANSVEALDSRLTHVMRGKAEGPSNVAAAVDGSSSSTKLLLDGLAYRIRTLAEQLDSMAARLDV